MKKDIQDILNKSHTTMKVKIGTNENPIRYEQIKANDPERTAKLKKQREQFAKDADAGKVLCLTDLFISHGM